MSGPTLNGSFGQTHMHTALAVPFVPPGTTQDNYYKDICTHKKYWTYC